MMSRHVINSSFYVNEKRNETKRGSDCLVSGRMRFLYYIHTVLYSTVQHTWCFTRDGTRKFPKYRKKRSTSSECKVQKWIWFGCTAAMCLKRVQSPHGNDSNGNKMEKSEKKRKTLEPFFGHMS